MRLSKILEELQSMYDTHGDVEVSVRVADDLLFDIARFWPTPKTDPNPPEIFEAQIDLCEEPHDGNFMYLYSRFMDELKEV